MKHQSATNEPRPVYFVSSRPEAYELYGEVDPECAKRLAQMISERAGRRFPTIEFRVDDHWHEHGSELVRAASYIEGHWQAWASKAGIH